MKRRILHKLRLGEISAVDRPCQAHPRRSVSASKHQHSLCAFHPRNISRTRNPPARRTEHNRRQKRARLHQLN